MKTVNSTILILAVLIMALAIPMAHAATEDSSQISISLVNQDPDPAIAGNTVEVRLSVENLGGKIANNVIVELTPEYPFQLVPGDNSVQKIGSINAYQSGQNMIILKYKVLADKDARSGTYDLKVKYYTEGSNIVQYKTLSVAVGNTESAEIIHIDKTLLVPGKQTSLKFIINNVGNAPLSNLKFSWENADKIILPVGSDNTRYIKYIDVGKNSEIEYQVIADTNAVLGLYQLDLTLTYDESATGTGKTVTTIAGVYVGGETDFDVAFSESSATQTSFSIANIGSNPANSVSVIIPEQRGWTVSGSNSFMIGNLNKGDYTVASFNLQSSTQSSAGNMTQQRGMDYQNRRQAPANLTQERFAQRTANSTTGALTIQIAYTDTMGDRHVVEKQVNIGSQNSIATIGSQTTFRNGQRNAENSFFTQYSVYIAAIVMLVILYFVRREYKKRKQIDPDFKFKHFITKKEQKRK